MSTFRYQHILGTVLCAVVLAGSEPLFAQQSSHIEEQPPSVTGPKIKLLTAEDKKVFEDSTRGENAQKYNLVGIALFSGKDFISRFIKKVTHSKISHVGIILADAKDENKWYCFESTGSVREVLQGHYPHVRVTPWKETVEKYHGKVSYRLAVFEDRERTDSRVVTDFVKEYDGKSYTKNPLKLLRALFRKNTESESQSPSTVFCSELAAKMLMNLEIINKRIASNTHPGDLLTIISKYGVMLTENFPANYLISRKPRNLWYKRNR